MTRRNRLRAKPSASAFFRRAAPALQVACALLSAGLAGATGAEEPARPIEVRDQGFVSSDACRACHPDAYATWHATYHHTMTQIASPESVRADFAGSQQAYGETIELERRGDEYWFRMPDHSLPARGGQPAMMERQVVLVTGSHHMQVYWFETGRSHVLGQFPLVWMIPEQRFIPFDSHFLRPPVPADIRGYQPPTGVWNRVCIHCHTTRARPQIYGPQNMNSDSAEFGIACEACHGPGEEHVRANRFPQTRYEKHLGEKTDASIVNPAHLDARHSSQVCGQCHGIYEARDRKVDLEWNRTGNAYRAGGELEKVGAVLVHEGTPSLFWSDGEVRVGGREYTGMVASPCYSDDGGFTCLSCHDLHKNADDPRPLGEWAAGLVMRGKEGNAACLGCHPAIAADVKAHTHHDPESTGSSCYECHMPRTSYGLRKAIRSHEITSPNVAVQIDTGRPVACTLCHANETLEWAADHLHGWYGQDKPVLEPMRREVPSLVVDLLNGDAGVRALAAWHLGWAPAQEASGRDWMPPVLAHALEDPYDAVRFIAGRSLQSLPGYEGVDYDFMAPPAARAAVARDVVEQWARDRRRAGEPPDAAAALGLKRRGPQDDVLARLVRTRDNRPIFLNE